MAGFITAQNECNQFNALAKARGTIEIAILEQNGFYYPIDADSGRLIANLIDVDISQPLEAATRATVTVLVVKAGAGSVDLAGRLEVLHDQLLADAAKLPREECSLVSSGINRAIEAVADALGVDSPV